MPTPERMRSMSLHLALLNHSLDCHSSCPSTNCAKMKVFLAHNFVCGGCAKKECTRLRALLHINRVRTEKLLRQASRTQAAQGLIALSLP